MYNDNNTNIPSTPNIPNNNPTQLPTFAIYFAVLEYCMVEKGRNPYHEIG